ncbi:hypothetical protein LTR91_024267 [Friedmanniomyces endolithicus]|uniref:Uncharacterized protein n=1 Tax=Friedmanniomyces endolithicus TaxID=329885 RepID=A0AAN6H7B7_9PEZI|nr:hypothetical protein LTR94_015824 [Friedmanniomyces endolithicus]KAK0773792.1 hypothetical protein LTR75_017031 [Friedmanniomyces endolithicus]KAK0776611.1 hypothetical protein LTR59_014153 [Friedmanniomyces endolithicus]KAK0782219.1 hypothetical protein LTR38_013446 [Friedmanniomyces endolithicus]KAK0846914.1 hypothetical protein LTR03_006594 [Friedmanniomyces endolithicus]
MPAYALTRQQSSSQAPANISSTSMSIPPDVTPGLSAYAVMTNNPVFTSSAPIHSSAMGHTASNSTVAVSTPSALSSAMTSSAMGGMAPSNATFAAAPPPTSAAASRPASKPSVTAAPPVSSASVAAGRPSGPPSGQPSGQPSGTQQGTPVAPPSGPPSGSSMPAPRPDHGNPEPKQECFQKADGTSICKWTEFSKQNSTDVMNQNGVFDYHNQHSENDGQAIAGKIPGSDVPSAIAGISNGPPAPGSPPTAMSSTSFGGTIQPATPNSGTTVFQANSEDSSSGSQDIHDSQGDHSNHMDGSSHDASSWQAHTQGQDSTNADISTSNDGKYESLVSNLGGVQDSTSTSSSNAAGGIEVIDQDMQRGNSAADIDWKNESKMQKEEHRGNGVYEFHEASSSEGSMSQGFNGANAMADAGKAYAEMLQSLGSGGQKERRAVFGEGRDDQEVVTLKTVGDLAGEQDVAGSLPAATELQDVLRPIGNGTVGGMDGTPSLGSTSGVWPVCMSLGIVAVVIGACALTALAKRRAEASDRRARLGDSGYQLTTKGAGYSDSA